jgi:hypothetical protein
LKGTEEGKVVSMFIKVLRNKEVWGMEVQLHIFLISALYGGEWSGSRFCYFTLGERASSAHWIGGWVWPRIGLDINA